MTGKIDTLIFSTYFYLKLLVALSCPSLLPAWSKEKTSLLYLIWKKGNGIWGELVTGVEERWMQIPIWLSNHGIIKKWIDNVMFFLLSRLKLKLWFMSHKFLILDPSSSFISVKNCSSWLCLRQCTEPCMFCCST